MKDLFKLSLIIMLFCSGNVISAQEDIGDDETTESTEYVDNFYIDDVVEKRMQTELRVLPYDYVREADIAWEKRIWRIIDVREKMNSGFKNFDNPFFSILREHLENADIKAFADDKFKEELLPADIEGRINRIDTVSFFNEDTYEEEIRIVPNEINVDDIKRYRVKEIWFFDTRSSTLKTRIIGIAPTKDVVDEEGNFKYEEVLFWVYYPEAREYLAKHQVINDFNDNTTMNWAALFDNRFFSSYIQRESNSAGTRLSDVYEDDIERLLESDKIKAELFNFEHDLWEY